MPKWMEYLIATIALPLMGGAIIGLSFAFLFASGQASNIKQIILVIVLLASPFILPFITVKFLNVAWWYPAVLLVVPGLWWFFAEIQSPNTHPYILLGPITFIAVVSLLAGKLGAKHGKVKIA